MIKINGAAFFAEYEKMRTLVVSENIKGDGNYDVSFNTISGIHISGYVSGSEIEGFDTVGSITVYNATINNGNEFFTITISSESIKEFTNDCELFCIEEITRYSVDTDVVSTKTPLYLINNKTGEELVARYTEAKTFGGISFDSFDKRIIVKPSDIIDGNVEIYIIDSPSEHKCTCSCKCKTESPEERNLITPLEAEPYNGKVLEIKFRTGKRDDSFDSFSSVLCAMHNSMKGQTDYINSNILVSADENGDEAILTLCIDDCENIDAVIRGLEGFVYRLKSIFE